MEMLDHSNSVWLHFFHLPPYTEWEKNHLNIALCLLLPTTGIKPRPSAQQASPLTSTLLPLGYAPIMVPTMRAMPLKRSTLRFSLTVFSDVIGFIASSS